MLGIPDRVLTEVFKASLAQGLLAFILFWFVKLRQLPPAKAFSSALVPGFAVFVMVFSMSLWLVRWGFLLGPEKPDMSYIKMLPWAVGVSTAIFLGVTCLVFCSSDSLVKYFSIALAIFGYIIGSFFGRRIFGICLEEIKAAMEG